MSSVSSTDSLSFMGPLIDNPKAGGGNDWEKAATKVGAALDHAESNMLTAFSFKDEKDSGFKKFLKQMGLSSNTTLQGLQMAMQIRYDKAKQLFSTLSNILFADSNTKDKVIDKIGR